MVVTRPHHERMWQRIVREMVERFAEARLFAKFLEGLVGSDQHYLYHVGALPDDVGESTRFLDRRAGMQIHGKIERVVPAGADRLRVFDDQVHRRRQCQRHGNNQDRHQAGKRLPRKAAEGGAAGPYVPNEPDAEPPG